MIRSNLIAATLSAAVACGVISTVPAAAGGSVSIDFVPASQRDADAMRLGLGLYALYNGIKNAGIKQRGRHNSAGLAQQGSGNFGVVHQEGRGHNGTVTQNGNCNAYGLFQFGRNTSSNIVQNGNCRTGARFQFGW